MTRRIRRRQPPRSPRVTTTFRGNCRVKHTRQNAIPANKPLIRKPTQAGDGASVRRHSSFVIRHSSFVIRELSRRWHGDTDGSHGDRARGEMLLSRCVRCTGRRGEGRNAAVRARALWGGAGLQRMQTPTDRARGPRAGLLYPFLSSIRCSVPCPGRAVQARASHDERFCLNSTVCCAMLSPSDSCDILHKSSVISQLAAHLTR